MEHWRSIRVLHDELGDPFQIMPMKGAASSLSVGLQNARDSFDEYMGEFGVSRKYWTAPCELAYEEIGMVIGAAFVLAQLPISQAVSIFTKIRELSSDKNRYPKSKFDILRLKSPTLFESGVSQIEAIDAIANYHKHYHEWPDDWNESQVKGVQANTIKTVKRIGFSKVELTNNMLHALSILNVNGDDLGLLCEFVHDWRKRLAQELYLDPYVASCLRV